MMTMTMTMTALKGVRFFELPYNHTDLVPPPISRSRLTLPRKLSFARASFDYEVLGLPSSRLVSPSIFAAEKEEAKAVLTLFLRKQGLSDAAAESTVNKSNLFIDHLVSQLPYLHKSRDRVGRELSTHEIRDALVPYLESCFEEHGDLLVDFVENFQKPPEEVKAIRPYRATPKSHSYPHRSKMAIRRVHSKGPDGALRPNIVYLMKLGLDLKHIEEMSRIYPPLPFLSLEQKLIPTVELLLDLGVCKSNIPSILIRAPSLFGYRISEKLNPAIAFLESLGVDKKDLASVIGRRPLILARSRKRIEELVGFFYEVGVPAKSVGRILTKYPNLVSCKVEDNLRPTAEFFHSLGIDVARLLCQQPDVFGLSIEKHLKPVAEFFLENGFSAEDIAQMIARFGRLWLFKVDTLSRKYDYFLTLGYSREELVKLPRYFSFSLEQRLKPRFELMEKYGLKLSLRQVAQPSDDLFQSRLAKRVRKLQSGNSSDDTDDDVYTDDDV